MTKQRITRIGKRGSSKGGLPCFPRDNVTQQGQAIAEGLLVMFSLLLLWMAVAWLGRMQDMALQATHSSRYMAFSATRGFDEQAKSQTALRYFSGSAHQWQDRSGRLLLDPDSPQLSLVTQRLPDLTTQAQPGGLALAVSKLRTEFHTADNGILRASSLVDVNGGPRAQTVSDLGISKLWPVLRRHTAILTGAGHGSDDTQVQQRLAAASTAWHDSSQISYQLSRKTDAAMSAVDKAWGRSAPTPEWLDAWTAQIPSHHLYP